VSARTVETLTDARRVATLRATGQRSQTLYPWLDGR